MAKETGLTARIPESFYDKPFVRRMLDPSTPTIEVDGEEASVETATIDGRLFPTIVKRELPDGSFGLAKLDVKEAYDEAVKTGNFIQFDSDEKADQQGRILSREAGALREAYKNNQNFLAQGGKGLGDVEFRADVEPYVGGDELTRLGLELYRRGVINLTALPLPQDERIGRGGSEVIGNYQGLGGGIKPSKLSKPFLSRVREQNPLSKENIMQSRRIAAYTAGVSDGPETDPETTFFRPRGQSELGALHELRHGALEYLFNTTDLRDQKYFDNYDLDVEEDIMDLIDNRIIKERQIPMAVDKVSKTNPKYIGGRDRLETVTRYATEALDELNVPERAEQERPSMLNRLLGMEQGGIMMAQQGQTALPMTQATSAPQGGGPKSANPAAKPALVSAPQQAPRPGEQDPRDAAIKEVADKMKPQTPPAPLAQPVGGLAAPQQPPAEPVPMMAKGGTPEEKPEGLAVMIGLGAPTPSYEEAAEGNPPPGATKDEVADDQLVLLSEGELVVPANVVRYHGLGAYEGMRREALMGLQDMEQNGQIEYVSGGKEKADKIDENGGIVKAQTGTFLMTNPQFPGQTVSPVYKPMTFQTPVAASQQFVTTPGQQPTAQTGTTTSLGLPTAQSTTALSPLLLPTVPSDITGVYAPNVGQYTQFQDKADSGDTTTPTTPTTPTPTTPADPRAGAADSGGGNDKDEPAPAATTLLGNKRYEYALDSSTRKPGIHGALLSLGNLDQVKLTDPDTGRVAFMSRDQYDKLKDSSPDFRDSIDTYMGDLFTAQEGVDYQRSRATEIYNAAHPVKGFVRGIASGLGYMDDFGPSKIENQAAAKAIADAMGTEYKGQSLAEMIVADQDFQRDTPAPVRGETPASSPSYGAPDFVTSMPAPATGLAAPTVATNYATMPGVKQSVPGVANRIGTVMTNIDPVTGAVSSVPMPQMSYANTAAMTPGQLATANALIDKQMAEAMGSTYDEVGTQTPASLGMSPGRSVAQFGTPKYGGIPTAPLDNIAAAAAEASRPLDTASMQRSIQRQSDIRNDLISKGVNPALAGIQAQRQYDREVSALSGVPDFVRGTSASAGSFSRDAVDEGDFETGRSYVGDDDDGPSPAQEAAREAANRAATKQAEAAAGYERDGYSADVAANKAAADAAPQKQTGDPNVKAVTDRYGNPVTSGGGKSIAISGSSRSKGKTYGDLSTAPPGQSGPDGADKGKIVCTEMYRQTQLDDWAKAIKIWDIYQKKYLTPLHEVGYHWLFKPYVHGMKRSGILTAAGAFLAKKRTQHLRHILTKGRAKDSFVGNVWCKIIHPIVYLVGKMIYKK